MYADGVMDESDNEAVQVMHSPNKWLTLLQYLTDPSALKAFLSDNCYPQTIQPGHLGHGTAGLFLRREHIELPTHQPVQLCTDNAGKWQAFHQYATIRTPSHVPYWR